MWCWGWTPPARDERVKGVVMRLGNGALSTAEAQEIAAALHRFRAKGKFVIAQATAFFGAGLGDYLAASAADEIWMQPKSPFSPSGAGGGEMFLRGTVRQDPRRAADRQARRIQERRRHVHGKADVAGRPRTAHRADEFGL